MFLTFEQLLERPKQRWLIEDVIPEKSLGVMWGKPASLKSFAAMSMAFSIAVGEPWMDFECGRGTVVYVAGEGQADLPERIKSWAAFRGVTDLKGVFRRLLLYDKALAITEPSAVSYWQEELESLLISLGLRPPRFIVFDTLSRCLKGQDENSASVIEKMVANLDVLRCDYDATVMLIHHGAKHTNEARGSVALKGAVDFEYEVVREERDLCEIYCRKMKSSREPDPIYLNAVEVNDSLTLIKS